MTFCTNCGKPMASNAAFCSACGEPVPGKSIASYSEEVADEVVDDAPFDEPESSAAPTIPVIVCTDCRTPLLPGSSTCVACGAQKDEPAASEAAPGTEGESARGKRPLLVGALALAAVGVAAVVGWVGLQQISSDDGGTAAIAATTIAPSQSETDETPDTTTTTAATATTTLPPPTTSAPPADLIAGVEINGVFVQPGSSADQAGFELSVTNARSHGWDLSVVALAPTAEGEPSAVADSVADTTGGATIVVVDPDTLAWSQDPTIPDEEFERAASLVPPDSDENQAVDSFVKSVLGGPDSVGVMDPQNGVWLLLRPDATQAEFSFGAIEDVPIIGDWDCDGIATPGVWRPSTAEIFLRNTTTEGAAEVNYTYDYLDALPLPGDFDGDGCDTVSFYHPEEGLVRVFNAKESEVAGSKQGGEAGTEFVFGDIGDVPFVGDFDGDGVDTVGLFRPSTTTMYLKNSLQTGAADAELTFGQPGDIPIAGDWGPQDGIDTVAVYEVGTGTFLFRYANTSGPADETLELGRVNALPVAGAFGFDRWD